MATQSSKERCRRIRATISKYRQKEHKRQQQDEFKKKKQQLKELDEFITKVFYNLDNAVQQSCGIPGKLECYMPSRLGCYSPCACLIREPEYAQLFQEKTGLPVNSSASDKDYAAITLSDTAKVCYGVNGTELDFASLITENQRRKKAWQEFVDSFSREIIDICVSCLNQTPNLYFGVPDRITITQDGRTAFAGSFNFHNLTIKYASLYPEQVDELTGRINQQISHGDVKIEIINHAHPTMWVTFHRVPEKIISNPYFDYQSFYQKYDIETPELRAVFNGIVDQLQLAPEAEQFANLAPQHELIYPIKDDAEYELLTQRLLGQSHERSLCLFLEDNLGIKITSIKASRTGEQIYSRCHTRMLYGDRKLKISYETSITATSIPVLVATQHPLIRQQLELDQQIQEIKQNRAKIAEILIDRFLDIAEQHIDKRALHRLPQEDSPTILDEDLSAIEIASHTVNLLSVTDIDFLTAVQQLVATESDQLIRIDFKNKNYYFF